MNTQNNYYSEKYYLWLFKDFIVQNTSIISDFHNTVLPIFSANQTQKPTSVLFTTQYLTTALSEAYLHANILTTISYLLPVWSLTTKEITEPIARLHNRAYMIHGNFPSLTHRCIALSHSCALTFQNYTTSQGNKILVSTSK